MAEEPEEPIKKVEHHRGNDYSSHYASGVILSGPTFDGLYQLHFYIDTLSVVSETATLIEGEENAYTLSVNAKEDLKQFREDKARISVTTETLKKIKGIIDKHISDVEAAEKDDSGNGE